MSAPGGEFNAVNEIIDLHYQIHRLSCLLDRAIARSGVTLQQGDLAAAEAAAMAHVQKKFPSLESRGGSGDATLALIEGARLMYKEPVRRRA